MFIYAMFYFIAPFVSCDVDVLFRKTRKTTENRIFNQDMKSTKNDKMLYIIGPISDYIIELLLYKRKSNYYEFYQISYTFLVDYHMLTQPIQE